MLLTKNCKVKSKVKSLTVNILFGNIFICNKYAVIWSGLEDSSHVSLCLCAFFNEVKMKEELVNKLINVSLKSLESDDVPIGALILKDNEIVAVGYNTRERDQDVLGHAEINAIRCLSKKINNWNLSGYVMYVSLKPCNMCLEVIKQARIEEVYYLLDNEKCAFRDCYLKKIDMEDKENKYKKELQDFFFKLRA